MSFRPNNYLYRHNHLSTLIPYFLRKDLNNDYVRTRVETPDGDFFDIDQLASPKNTKTAVLLHGLEGSSRAQYIQSLAQELFQQGYNVCAMNFRSCSGEMNRTPFLYHSGETGDLRYLLKNYFKQQEIYLVGFSLGGNVLLKYLGEEAGSVDARIKKAVAISAPIDLTSSSLKLSRGLSLVYSLNFMSTLKVKVRYIKKNFKPKVLQNINENRLFTFPQFDHQVTAPLHGFKGADDYWTRSSSLPFLKQIKIPALLINAQNDPFLGQACFPSLESVDNNYIQFSFPKYGGHVGFIEEGLNYPTYTERSVLEFFNR